MGNFSMLTPYAAPTKSGYGVQIPPDGFTLNPAISYLPYDYFSGALAQMDVLRRANTYRARWYVVPDDFNQPLAAYSTLEYQFKVAAGSYLWGLQFAQYNATWARVTPTGVVFQVTEACTGIPLFREFQDAQPYSFEAVTNGRLAKMPFILTQPRLFLAPGDVNVELCNLGSAVVRCSLVLYFAEPCHLIED